MRSLVCLLLLAGCFDDGHSCPPTGAVAKEPAQTYRDPSDGQCTAIGGGIDPVPCDPQCGPCIYNTGGAGVGALPDWASCYGPCTALDEQQCLQSTTCHTTHSTDGVTKESFWQCWDLPPSGAVTGACTGLDAQTCSEHPDCISLYMDSGTTTSFSLCEAKTPLPACSTLATETDCKARPDCDPIYIGMNCTCTSSGCTCATETYDHCQAR